MESMSHDVSKKEQTNEEDGGSTPRVLLQASLFQEGNPAAQLNSQSEAQAPVLPPLQTILQAVSYMPGHIRFGRRNDERRSPVSKALTSLYGGTWTVSAQAIRWLIGSGKNERRWEWRTPEDYAQVLSGIDDPNWKEGQPQKTITIAEFTSTIRYVIACSGDAHQREPIRAAKQEREKEAQ